METKTETNESRRVTSSSKNTWTDLDNGVWYHSKVSGLWYRSIGVAVPVDAIRIDGEIILTATLDQNAD